MFTLSIFILAALSFVDGGEENTLGLITLAAALVFNYSSLVPGRYSGTPINFLNFMFLKRLRITSYIKELEIQYMLKAAGNVIQTGTEIRGRT